MIECHHVMQWLWEYIDGALDEPTAREVADHLAMCGRCYPEYAVQLRFLEEVARSGRSDPSAAPSDEFRARLRRSLDAIREPGAPTSAPLSDPRNP